MPVSRISFNQSPFLFAPFFFSSTHNFCPHLSFGAFSHRLCVCRQKSIYESDPPQKFIFLKKTKNKKKKITEPQILPHEAEAGQGPEAEPAHSAVDPAAYRQHHPVRPPFFLIFNLLFFIHIP
jgi:hypothetical protein